MKNIPRPNHAVATAIDLCADGIEDEDLAERLREARDLFIDGETDYDDKAELRALFQIAEATSINGTITVPEMRNLYSNVFSREGGPTRHIYDSIRSLAPGRICPYCNHRIVSTLDHFLSKVHHPVLAITPLNLVPACRDCNMGSGTRRATCSGDQTLHPYYDSVDDEVWLFARLVEDSPPGVSYYVTPPANWDLEVGQSLETHFEAFGLAELYAANAGTELLNLFSDLVNHDGFPTSQSIRSHLAEVAQRRRWPFRNSWQAALYQAAADSDWFCEGGYLHIREPG